LNKNNPLEVVKNVNIQLETSISVHNKMLLKIKILRDLTKFFPEELK